MKNKDKKQFNEREYAIRWRKKNKAYLRKYLQLWRKRKRAALLETNNQSNEKIYPIH